MTRIAIASCCKIEGQRSLQVQPAWKEIEDAEPDLLLLLGDNVYMRQGGPIRWDFKQLEGTYKKQFAEPNFASVIKKVPFAATWDDHDFGPNDSRGDTPAGRKAGRRLRSRDLFHKYMAKARNNNRPNIHHAFTIGDVKVIVLDSRFHRTDLRVSEPTVLGSEQEEWLWKQLDHDKKYTVVACGTCLESGGDEDRWTAYRAAYRRLRERLEKAPRVLFVAGDIHRNMFKSHGKFHEVVSSGIGRHEDDGPRHNYGLLDFGASRVKVSLKGRRKVDNIDVSIRASGWTVE